MYVKQVYFINNKVGKTKIVHNNETSCVARDYAATAAALRAGEATRYAVNDIAV